MEEEIEPEHFTASEYSRPSATLGHQQEEERYDEACERSPWLRSRQTRGHQSQPLAADGSTTRQAFEVAIFKRGGATRTRPKLALNENGYRPDDSIGPSQKEQGYEILNMAFPTKRTHVGGCDESFDRGVKWI